MHLFWCDKQEGDLCTLSLEESQHCAKVLRLKIGANILVTNGQGCIYECELISVSQKECVAQIITIIQKYDNTQIKNLAHIAVAPTKNIDRMEWFVEKAIEIGIREISFVKTVHSERTVIKMDRIRKIAIAAMKQSQQAFLPKINEICSLREFLNYVEPKENQLKCIAYCGNYEKIDISAVLSNNKEENITVLIGPEGDFSEEEVNLCVRNKFKPITLGNNRLRTETAALYASWVIAFNKREF